MSKRLIIGLLFALLVAAFLSPFASSSPDGLERVAQDKGFYDKQLGQEKIKPAMAGYNLPGIDNQTVSGSAAGVVGTVLTFGVVYTLSKLAARKRGEDNV